MSFLVLKKNKFFEYLETIKSEKLGVYVSSILHFTFLLYLIGLPDFFESKSNNAPIIIPIEIINIADTTSISKNIAEKKNELKKEVAIKEKKFNSSNNQKIKKIIPKDVPEIENKATEKNIISKDSFVINEKKITSRELKKKKIEINEKDIESRKIKKIKPKPSMDNLNLNKEVAIKEKPKLKSLVDSKEVAIKEKPKLKSLVDSKEVAIKEKPKPKTEFNIASLLKDIRNDQINPKNEIKEEVGEEKVQKINKSKEKTSEENTILSISEIDLVLQQLSRCFIAPLGSKIEKTAFVKISAKILQNRRVVQNSIRIVDTNIDISNPFYGPITRSSMNTFLNPDCIPLKLPEDKYDLWKNITLTFDYSIMKGN